MIAWEFFIDFKLHILQQYFSNKHTALYETFKNWHDFCGNSSKRNEVGGGGGRERGFVSLLWKPNLAIYAKELWCAFLIARSVSSCIIPISSFYWLLFRFKQLQMFPTWTARFYYQLQPRSWNVGWTAMNTQTVLKCIR